MARGGKAGGPGRERERGDEFEGRASARYMRGTWCVSEVQSDCMQPGASAGEGEGSWGTGPALNGACP